jgi:integrase
VPRSEQRRLHFPQFVEAQRGNAKRLHPHGELPARVLKTLETKLGLPKLNFQVLRRTMATLAQTKGSIKDVQGILGHSKADTTVNVYMQEIEASVKQTQGDLFGADGAAESRDSVLNRKIWYALVRWVFVVFRK